MTVKSCEKAEKSQVVLTVEVEREEFQSAIEKAYRKMRGRMRVPGFRPGKAPRKLVESVYGPEVFYNEAINASYPDAFDAAVKELDLKIVGYPKVEVPEPPTPDGYIFTATAPVYPEVTLGQYKGLSAPRAVPKVSEADVDSRIQQLADRNTRLVSVDRPAKEGDIVVIDFEGFLDGKPFENGSGQNYNLELGSHSFVPGFEEQLVGVSAEEERDLDITFPDSYAQNLAGKDTVFKVKVHEVKEKDVPDLDDEFAKDVSEFDTLAELREDLKAKLLDAMNKDAQHVFEDALMEQVADGITADVPEVMVDRQARQFVENVKNSVYRQGLTYEQYLQLTGSSEEHLLEEAQEPALKQVRMDLAVTAIIEEEHLEATPEDIEAEYKQLAEESGMDTESMKKYVTEDQVKDQVLAKKAIAIVADSATATDPLAEDTSAEDTAAENE